GLYVDGARVTSRPGRRAGLGNALPLEIGRSGPSARPGPPLRSDADGCDDSDQSDRSDRSDTGHLPPSTSAEPSLNQSAEPSLIASAEPSLIASAEPSLIASAEPESPQAGAHWLGKLDDLRIWKIARSAPDIRASFK